MYFLAKVRIDRRKLAELAGALKDGALDRSRLKTTHCLANDPAVGFALWEADDRAHFDAIFAPHATFYAEVLEVNQVITPPEAMAALVATS
jgi:hypothetical protein